MDRIAAVRGLEVAVGIWLQICEICRMPTSHAFVVKSCDSSPASLTWPACLNYCNPVLECVAALLLRLYAMVCLKVQGSEDNILRLRWLHALRMKDMRGASNLIESSRELHGIGRNLEEACCLDSIGKLALLAAQRPGSSAMSAEVRYPQSGGAASPPP